MVEVLMTILFVALYLLVAVITYGLVESMLISTLDIADEEDREILSNTKVMNTALAIISLLWIVYIPYLLLSSIAETIKCRL